MSKRCRLARQLQTIDSIVHECKVHYEQIEDSYTNRPICSNVFSASGRMWQVKFFCESDQANYRQLIVLLELVSACAEGVYAKFEAFLLHWDGQPRDMAACSGASYAPFDLPLFQDGSRESTMHKILQTDLKEKYVTDGHFTFTCVVVVVCDRSIPVLASEMGKHFGSLFDSSDGTNVSFIIGTETVHAHRAVLATYSLVFKAQLFGHMVESTMSSIPLRDIIPSTLRAMLRFVYTDAFLGVDLLGDSPSEMVQHLLAAAGRYALDWLKLMCAQKLWEGASINMVARILHCAKMYSCLELMNKCIDFFELEDNFKKAVLTKSFV